MWDTNTPAITTSLRGLIYEEVKITCADHDLHSGQFGGAAQTRSACSPKSSARCGTTITASPFPASMTALTICRLTSRPILPPSGSPKRLSSGRSGSGGFPPAKKGRLLIEQITTRPTAEIDGIIGGYTGEGAKTVIQGEASAKVSFRLVGRQDPDKIKKAFRQFVRDRLPTTARSSSAISVPARRCNYPSTIRALVRAREVLGEEWGRKAVTVGAGGSIPIVSDFKTCSAWSALMVGFALDDDRVHSPNEKFDLKCFHKGIRSWARMMDAELAQG